MPVEWLDDPRAFAARDWTRLVDADPDATVFHTPRWLKLYWEEFGPDGLRIALVRRGDEDIAAAAFERHGTSLRWLGGSEVTDYMGPVSAPADRVPAARELLAALCGADWWSAADLGGLPEDGAWLGTLREAAEAVGMSTRIEADGVAPFVPLAGSFDDYLGALSPKQRHEIRRKDRRLRQRYADARLVDAAPQSLGEAMEAFVAMHRSSAGEKGRFMLPGMELFFRRFAHELSADGTLRLSFVESGGERLAGAIGFRWRDRFLLYNSAFDQAHADVAPGMVLTAELIRAAIDERRGGFDMLKGNLRYKYRFGARPRRIMRLRVERGDR